MLYFTYVIRDLQLYFTAAAVTILHDRPFARRETWGSDLKSAKEEDFWKDEKWILWNVPHLSFIQKSFVGHGKGILSDETCSIPPKCISCIASLDMGELSLVILRQIVLPILCRVESRPWTSRTALIILSFVHQKFSTNWNQYFYLQWLMQQHYLYLSLVILSHF